MKIGKTLLYILIAAGLLGGGAYIISKTKKKPISRQQLSQVAMLKSL